MTASALPGLGCVAIGRNEGERLRRCLESLRRDAAHIVYVDSGSTDGSVEMARQMAAHVVALDTTIPFTAARARNEGWRRLAQIAPSVEYVQFVDGDCEVVAGWMARAQARLKERPEVAVVCGRRRERHVDASIYNRLCDVEWDTPVGDARFCGGDALIRMSALREVNGYDPALIAGEEPELSVRLRARGHTIERLDAEMTLHDAAMTRFSQWWKRQVRSGHAYAEGAALHGAPPERHFVTEQRRSVLWAAVVPAAAIGGALPTLGLSTLLLWGYPLSAARVYAYVRRRGRSRVDAAAMGAFSTLGKFAELQGILKFHVARARGQRSTLIEYKGPSGT